MLFDYPERASYGRTIPKSKIYDRAQVPNRVKRLFVDQVEQITWQFKLAPETTNVSKTRAVPEIQVFHVKLRNGDLSHDVLRCIDRAIPFPLIFEVLYEDKIKSTASYKRPSEADSSKWVISTYFESEWHPIDETRQPFPVVLDLGALYVQLLAPLLPYPVLPGEGLCNWISRMEQIRAKQYELAQVESRLRKEKQFNRKVEINAELRSIQQEIQSLTAKPTTNT